MNRRFLTGAVLWAFLCAAALATDVPIGGKTQVVIRLRNHTSLELQDLRLTFAMSGDWLAIQTSGQPADLAAGGDAAYPIELETLKQAEWGDRARLEVTFQCRFAGEQERTFLVTHEVEAVPAELRPAGTAREIDWHIVSARPGTLGNKVLLTVRNSGKEAIRGFALFATASSEEIVPRASPITMPEEKGDPKIPAEGSLSYAVNFAVEGTARPGGTGVLSLKGRAGSRTEPLVYEAEVLVAVDEGGGGGSGNFEGFACYNLAPPPGTKPSTKAEDWLTVPKGTELKVSQVYEMPGPGGLHKPVEQFVGYGHVLDGRGYFRLRIDPVGAPPYRLRLVAETMAREVRALPNAMEPERYEVGHARAAVSPTGRRTWRVISPVFQADREPAQAGARTEMLQPVQEKSPFIAGKRILLPYYGYARDVDPEGTAEPGILIDWEGELSTGGHINFFMGETAFQNFTDYYGDYAKELADATDIPGLLWHNRPELLHILGQVVAAQDWVRGVLPEKEEIPPAIAFWKPGLSLSPGETGYWLREDGLWRLEVSGAEDDPDEADSDLITRGYGAAVRRMWIEGGAASAKPLAPAERRYRYDARTTPERAFALGFDTFFACAVARKSWVENAHASDEKLKGDRSFDVEALLAKLREAVRQGGTEALLKSDIARLRGLDNPGAVAAGLYLAWRSVGDSLLAELLAPPREGESAELRGLTRFLDLVGRRAPSIFPDLVLLGLAPQVEQVPSAALAAERVAPADVIVTIDARGMIAKADISAFLVLGQGVSVPFKMTKGEAVGVATPGSLGSDGRAPAFADGQRVTWQVALVLGEAPPLPGPAGGFTASVSGTTVGAAGGQVPIRDLGGRRGQLTVPPGSFDAPRDLSVAPLARDGDIDGKKVMGGTVYDVSKAEFLQSARMQLAYDPAELPAGAAPPSIHRQNQATGAWENLGGDEVEPGLVEAVVDHASLFALLADPRLPSPEAVSDAPDPFRPGPGSMFEVRFTLPCASEVTFEVVDAEGRLVARPADLTRLPAGPVRLTWDGKGANGEEVPDGEYGYTIGARDRVGREGDPGSGRVTVYRGFTGGVRGKARAEGARPRVRSLDGAAFALAGDDGSWFLSGLPPGDRAFSFEARGYFPEERKARVAEFADAELPEVVLTNRALAAFSIDPPVLRPGEEGASEAGIHLRWDRACEARVEVVDRQGRAVRLLFSGRVAPGDQGLGWGGEDDRRRPLAGLHLVRVTAVAGGEPVLQGEAKVLVDRGLVRFARAIPRIFSPDGDAFDDATSVTLELSDNAVVTATLVDAAGLTVRELLHEEAVPAGWVTREWDGRDAAGSILAEGTYQLRVEARYETGEASKPARSECVLDLSAPRFAEIEPANGSALPNGRVTVRARLERAGDLDPSSLRVKIDELAAPPDAFDPATGWLTYTPKTSLGEGVHIALVYARDLAENLALPEATSFTVKLADPDRAKPTVACTGPGEDATVYSPRPAIEATLRDDGSGIDADTVTLAIDGEVVENRVRRVIPGRSGKSWDQWQYEVAVVLFDPLEGRLRYNPLKPLKEGRHVVRIQVADRRGNLSLPAEESFTLVADTVPPSVSLGEPAARARLFAEEFEAAAALADEGGSGIDPGSIFLALDGVRVEAPPPVQGWLEVPLRAEDGAEHMLSLSVRDRAGNEASCVVMFSVAVDREPPRVECSPPFDGDSAVHAGGEIRGEVFDDASGVEPASVHLLLDGAALPFQVEGGRFAQALPEMAPGVHRLSLTASDRAGNWMRRDWDLRVRAVTEPPEIRVESPEAQPPAGAPPLLVATLVQHGAAIDPVSIRVRMDGRLVPLPPGGFDPVSGRLRLYLPEAAEAGVQHVVTIDAADTEGNSATATREFVGKEGR